MCLRGGSRERKRGLGDSKFQRGERKGKEDRDREIETETEREKHREKMRRREGADQSCRKQHFSFLILYVWFQPAWHQQ